MSAARSRSLGVDWHLPDSKGGYRKRRFATTTVASSDLIVLLAEDGDPGPTWTEMVRLINYDEEARAIARRFVDEGHGDALVRTMVG